VSAGDGRWLRYDRVLDTTAFFPRPPCAGNV